MLKFYKSKTIDKWLAKIQMAEVPNLSPRRPEFRVSSLPYCPILYLESLLGWHEGGSTKTYQMRFYTDIGTAVHSAFQEFAKVVHPKTFYGNWKCSRQIAAKHDKNTEVVVKCNKIVRDITCFDKLKVGKCPHGFSDCKSRFEYEEILFLWNGISGHMDCLILLDGKWWLLDWKTTSNYIFNNTEEAIRKKYYPNEKYIEQIESYAVLLKMVYNIDISYYVISYIGREKPTDIKKMIESDYSFVFKMDKRKFKKRLRLLKQQTDNHKAVERLLKKATTKDIDYLIENKPCHSKEDFKNGMKKGFFGSEQCEYCKNGDCFDKKKIRKIIKQTLHGIKECEND